MNGSATQPPPPLPTVLFVDDDERLLESLKIVLRREPYEIVTVTSLASARRLLGQRRIDVIVCDEKMPYGSGTALLAELVKTEHPAVRISLTGAGLPAAQRAINDGAVFRFLAKPCSSVAIAQALRDALVVVSRRGVQPAPRPPKRQPDKSDLVVVERPDGRYSGQTND